MKATDGTLTFRVAGKTQTVIPFIQVAQRTNAALIFMGEDGQQVHLSDSNGDPIQTVDDVLKTYTDGGRSAKAYALAAVKGLDSTGCHAAYRIVWEWMTEKMREGADRENS